MKLLLNITKNNATKQPVVIAIGTFDGMHMGHQFLIKKLISISKRNGCAAMIYTFYNHPLMSLSPGDAPRQLMTLKQKILAFKRLGIDIVALNKFDLEFSKMTPKQFIENLLRNYDLRCLVVGSNFRFGSNGAGDIHTLKYLSKKNAFEVMSVPPYKMKGKVISSSLIRTLIQQGEVAQAACFLGYPYSMSGEIISGMGRGRKIGFPTANLGFDRKMAIPGYGVYLTKGLIDGKVFWGATSVGSNPTFGQSGIHIETYFIDFNGNIYKKRLKLFFIQKVRELKYYQVVEDLVDQISKDIELVKNLICKS